MTGPPFFKYYAGTPLTSTKGINIGSLFILDNVVRPRLTIAQQSFLGSIAQIVMEHMETSREALEMKKVMRMSRGLNAFVEGKSSFGKEENLPGNVYDEIGENASNKESNLGRNRVRKEEYHANPENEPCSTTNNNSSTKQAGGSSGSSPTVAANPPAQDLPRNVRSSADRNVLQSEMENSASDENKDIGHRSTIMRAANLLLQSLDLQPGGGVVYLDMGMGLSTQDHDEPASPTLPDDALNDDSEGNVDPASSEAQRDPNILRPAAVTYDSFGRVQPPQIPADVIGFSVNETAVDPQEASEHPWFTPLGQDLLQYLLKRYPRGSLWTFDEDGSLSSSEEDITSNENRSLGKRQAQAQRRQSIASMLQKHFPGGESQKQTMNEK